MANPFERFRRWWSGEPEPLLPDVENQPHGQPATFLNRHPNGYPNEYRNQRQNDQNGGQRGEYRYDYGNYQRGSYRNETPNNFRNDHRKDLRNDLRNEYHNNRHDGRYGEYRNRHRNTYRNNPGNNPRNDNSNHFDNGHRNARHADYLNRNGNFNDNHNNHRDRNRNDYPSSYRINYRQPSYESEESDSSDDDYATCPNTNPIPSDVGTVRPSPRPGSLRSFQRLSPDSITIAGSSRDSSVPSTAASRVFDSGPESPRRATPPTSIDGHDDDFRGCIYDVVSDDDTDSDTTYVPRPFDDTLRSEHGSSNPPRSSDRSGSSYSSDFHLPPRYRYARVPSTVSVNTTDDGSVETVIERDFIHNNNSPLGGPPIASEVPASERSDRHPVCHAPCTHRGRDEVPRKKRTHRRKRSPTKKQEKRPEHQKKEVSRVPIPYFAGKGFAGNALKKAARNGRPGVVRSILANAPDNYLQSTEFSKAAILECVKKPSEGTYMSLEALVDYVDKAKFNNMRDDRKTLPFLLLSEASRNNFSKYQRRSLRLLLKVVTCVDEKNGPESQTALHLAVAKRLPRAVVILLARGASPDIADENGKTARDLADDKLRALSGRESRQEAEDWVQIQKVLDEGVGHAD